MKITKSRLKRLIKETLETEGLVPQETPGEKKKREVIQTYCDGADEAHNCPKFANRLYEKVCGSAAGGCDDLTVEEIVKLMLEHAYDRQELDPTRESKIRKITKSRLQKIVKEEIEAIKREARRTGGASQ